MMKKNQTTIKELTSESGISATLTKTTGLSRPYYSIDVLNKEMFSSRQLKTTTMYDAEKADKIMTSLISQLSNNVGFWDLKFTTN